MKKDLEDDTDSLGFKRLRKEVSNLIGVDYQNYSKSHLRRRFHARMRVVNKPTFSEYNNYFKNSEEEVEKLRKLLTVNVTRFKRDEEVWKILEKEVIPKLIEQKSGEIIKKLKFWSAGCATGEEPYSLAMTYLKNDPSSDIKCSITATDLDHEALSFARNGEYPEKSLKNVTISEKREYFEEVEDGYKVKNSLKDLVNFKRKDIFKTNFSHRFDLILCRNLMIYFNNEAKTQLMERLVESLNKDGFLVIGMSENLREPAKSQVETYNLRRRVFVKR